ncbi:LysR family transcriptional regulator [Rhizobium sp. XQZ8]|uniref:LysR family transcriptional regulator n=1 Tax=Rhizobium populisoli TaxID=2859785 RepID=UPI001C67D967|nr:LysR family transcriptional regulator [Rhizobium populisoli]MBW6420071.1 LysR family transcriptional regulator [Rhizobium populisoli]
MMRADLNDMVYFAEVVTHGGFAAAGRVLREPKSKLSRRIAGLEARLGVRLIERSSRRFRVTDIGQSFYERCKAMITEAERAETLVAEAQSEPHGVIRISCPTGMVEPISGLVTKFLEMYPKVRLQIVALDRAVDLIEERIDVALRVRSSLDSDASLTMRSLGHSVRILVASPQLASRIADIGQLSDLPILATSDDANEIDWHLETDDGRRHTLRHLPRMGCADFGIVRTAAIAGLGVALLPDHSCRDAIAAGTLVRVLPAWRGVTGVVHLVFTTRKGLPLAVRKFIDSLASGFPRDALAR